VSTENATVQQSPEEGKKVTSGREKRGKSVEKGAASNSKSKADGIGSLLKRTSPMRSIPTETSAAGLKVAAGGESHLVREGGKKPSGGGHRRRRGVPT